MRLRPTQAIRTAALAGAAALMLAGCDGSGRFSDFGGGRQAVAPPPPRAQTFTPAPTGRVETSELPPVVGSALPPRGGPNPALDDLPPPGPGGPPTASGLPPAGSSVPIEPEPRGPLRQAEPPSEPPRQPQVAARSEPPPRPAAPSRTSVTGNWTAREASGGSCRVTLSSAPTLDLYKASSSGCQSRELQRISAWELRGDEVYLYEPGGGIAARLKQSGGTFEGAAAKTGAPVTLTK